MARSIPHDPTRPTGSYIDPFGDGAYDEPFSTGNLNYDDTKTSVTSGVTARDPTNTILLAGPTEAESLAADYRQHNASPSLLKTPDRLPTPSPHDNTLPYPSDIMMNIPYHDDDSPSSHRPPSVLGKPDASLVHNAAGMGRSSGYQDLGTWRPRLCIRCWTHALHKNTQNPQQTTRTPCQKRGLLSEVS